MSGELLKEKWVQWVALTTTILAVCAAISTLRGGSYSTRVQLLTVQENNTWAYFQAKSIKEHIYDMQMDILSLEALKPNTPETSQYIQGKLKEYKADVARYKKEKDDLKSQAEQLDRDSVGLKRHGGNFSMAIMFFQIAIMMSSVGALFKKRRLWAAGLLMGGLGLVYFLNGFWLFF